MRDNEEEIYYEVEVMLGALDESHIIRTIEYWDIERQRRPQWDHRAVIVAEEITTRFFNVLRLLNRAVPLVAIKLSAFRINEKVFLHPITVLDVIEESTDPDALDPVERADRSYWEKKSPTTLSVADQIVSLLRTAKIEPRLTYNRGHMALGTTGRNFCWFYPRKVTGTCFISMRFTDESRDSILASLQENTIDASPRQTDKMTFTATTTVIETHADIIKSTLESAEQMSR
jgi:hypothetical protein